MARTAQEFLTDWRKSYIYAEARAPDELDDTVAECVKDAAQDGSRETRLIRRPAAI